MTAKLRPTALLLPILLLTASLARGQTTAGNITTFGVDCSVATNCVQLNVGANSTNILIVLGGSFTGATAQFEFLIQPDNVWHAMTMANLQAGYAAVTSATATGEWQTSSPPYTSVRVRASALSSGTINVSISATANTSVVGLSYGNIATGPIDVSNNPTAGYTPCYVKAGTGTTNDTTNHANCKAAPGTFYGIRAINTSATLAYARMYNLSTDATCSSATGFVESIPIPASTTGAGWIIPDFTPYNTGIAYCITGGGANNDNTAPPAGVFIKINTK